MTPDNSTILPCRFKNIAGRRSGRLVAVSFAFRRGRKTYWNYRCDCGVEKTISTNDISDGKIVSCGCHKNERVRIRNTTHGKSGTYEHRIWMDMISRCKYDTHADNYRDRGIIVCERWKNSFELFLSDMGHCPKGRSIDRINNDGNYEPSNCRWATRKEQNRNKRNNVSVVIDGVSHCLSQWSEISGIARKTIDGRLKRGWSEHDAVFSPVRS